MVISADVRGRISPQEIGHARGVRRAFERRMLHERCAAASGLRVSPCTTWSACHGSFGLAGSLQIQQRVASSLIRFASRRYSWL